MSSKQRHQGVDCSCITVCVCCTYTRDIFLYRIRTQSGSDHFDFRAASRGIFFVLSIPVVRTDMEAILNHMVKEREPYYEHTMEGSDDMPAHAKCSLFGVSLTIPITNGKLNMGTWQGIYLCEFRNHGGSRKIVATIYE